MLTQKWMPVRTAPGRHPRSLHRMHKEKNPMLPNRLMYPLLLTTALAIILPFGQAIAQEDGAQDQTEVSTPEDSEKQLQTVVVRGEFIPEPQRQTSQVASFLSSEDLARTGDDNAALA
ncbi:MAG: hypothetical protein KDA43_04835, partial [Hyphomonas sp.]|nr:hypothetical protein [Hyphomonas sp.]